MEQDRTLVIMLPEKTWDRILASLDVYQNAGLAYFKEKVDAENLQIAVRLAKEAYDNVRE